MCEDMGKFDNSFTLHTWIHTQLNGTLLRGV